MPNRFLLLLLLVSLAGCDRGPSSTPPQQVYPWQISVLPNGNSQVFGITFDKTTLEEAKVTLGTRYEAGLFENPDGSLSLEVFFNEVTLGGISGKFILTLKADPAQLQDFRQRAIKAKTMESGARRYQLARPDQLTLGAMTISAIGYIPYVNLDEEMIIQRFGTPARKLQVVEGKQHYLYPDKGLDLLLDEDGKELLQYVAPKSFPRLQEPLLKQYGS